MIFEASSANGLKRDNLLGPTNFVNAATSDPGKIGLAVETTMVLRLMNLFGTTGHTDRFDPWVLHNRSHLSHFRWLVYHRSILSLVVLDASVFVRFENVHEPACGSNFASV